MSLQNRTEKLQFLAEEIDLGFFLASHAPDDFVARTLARHVLIRIENLIEHARALHRPLKQAGHDVRHFHRTKEVYAKAFEEYFKASRNKLGAHVRLAVAEIRLLYQLGPVDEAHLVAVEEFIAAQ